MYSTFALIFFSILRDMVCKINILIQTILPPIFRKSNNSEWNRYFFFIIGWAFEWNMQKHCMNFSSNKDIVMFGLFLVSFSNDLSFFFVTLLLNTNIILIYMDIVEFKSISKVYDQINILFMIKISSKHPKQILFQNFASSKKEEEILQLFSNEKN